MIFLSHLKEFVFYFVSLLKILK